ncbi:hypothetical protein MRX96_057743 [Rhipicephalus microplus]
MFYPLDCPKTKPVLGRPIGRRFIFPRRFIPDVQVERRALGHTTSLKSRPSMTDGCCLSLSPREFVLEPSEARDTCFACDPITADRGYTSSLQPRRSVQHYDADEPDTYT